MSRNMRSVSRSLTTALGLLLLGTVAAFANHGGPLSRVFATPSTPAAATAQQAPPTADRPLVKVVLSGTLDRGDKHIPVDESGPAKPGELVTFTINSENTGTSAAHDYRTTGRVPDGTSFVEGSARGDGDSHATYSIDGGRNYSPRPMIDERQPDGTIKSVPAPASMYTHVRFQWSQPLDAGKSVSALYQVRVK